MFVENTIFKEKTDAQSNKRKILGMRRIKALKWPINYRYWDNSEISTGEKMIKKGVNNNRGKYVKCLRLVLCIVIFKIYGRC